MCASSSHDASAIHYVNLLSKFNTIVKKIMVVVPCLHRERAVSVCIFYHWLSSDLNRRD